MSSIPNQNLFHTFPYTYELGCSLIFESVDDDDEFEKVEDDSVNQTRANINFVLENAGVIITKKKTKK